MNFLEPMKISSGLFCWSPCGKYCAIPSTAKLEIRDGSTLQLLNVCNCAEYIQALDWSPDSSLIYTANFKRSIIEVWQPRNTSWKCKIDEGSVGLGKVYWSPDSRHLLTFAEFNLRITIWSLINKTVQYIKHPKDICSGLQFSNEGYYLAVAERRDCKDYLSIFETKSWSNVKVFEVNTQDLSGINWSPNDSVLAVWDSPSEYKILIYTLTGECLSSYTAYQWTLGIRCVQWSPTSQYLAIGSYDSKVRFMNYITWKVLFEFEHLRTIESEECLVYKEKEENLTRCPSLVSEVHGFPSCSSCTYEEEQSRPVHIGKIPVEFGKEVNPKIGVSNIDFSFDGRYFSSRIDNSPTTLWIWNVETMTLVAVLVHCNHIRDVKWSPKRICLALCTGGSNLYLWTPFGAVAALVPNSSSMFFINLRWNPSGSKIALLCKNSYTICTLNSDTEKEAEGPDDQRSSNPNAII